MVITFCFETAFDRSGGKKVVIFKSSDGIVFGLYEEWKSSMVETRTRNSRSSNDFYSMNSSIAASQDLSEGQPRVEYSFISKQERKYCVELSIYKKSNPKMNSSLTKLLFLDVSSEISITYQEFKIFGLHRGDTTPLICKVDFIPFLSLSHVPPPASPITPTAVASTEKRLEKFSSDMESLFEKGTLSDVVLVSETTEMNAHKVILSARSPVFAKMFDLRMKENLENRVTITDVDSTVLKELVSFMYTGTITLRDTKVVRGLYTAADKYGINDLKAICSSKLRNLTLDTVTEAFILAEIYNDRDLKEATVNFIAANYDQLKTKESWNIFLKKYPVYSVEIFKYVMDRKI